MHPITAERLFTPEKISERLKAALDGRRVAVHGRGSELARITGTSPQAAARWLSGQVVPSIVNLLRIAHAFGISVEWLITGEGMMFVDREFLELADDWRHADESGKRIIKTLASQVSARERHREHVPN